MTPALDHSYSVNVKPIYVSGATHDVVKMMGSVSRPFTPSPRDVVNQSRTEILISHKMCDFDGCVTLFVHTTSAKCSYSIWFERSNSRRWLLQ